MWHRDKGPICEGAGCGAHRNFEFDTFICVPDRCLDRLEEFGFVKGVMRIVLADTWKIKDRVDFRSF
jgi:hypothetical protein